MKKIIALLAALILLLSLTACSSGSKEKAFSKNGLDITLTNEFSEETLSGYTACYRSTHTMVVTLKEDFSLIEGAADLSVTEYAELLRQANASRSPTSLSTKDGIPYFEYTYFNESENVTYRYYTTAFKGSDAFWMVQFVCNESAYVTQKVNFSTWAKSISVS